ncbi:pseudouridine synthase family protein [Shewanella intestini]|uniref:RNA pseudouridine synthase n=1 Tax=Shewanella intestini TaxID=2017544 RepID=A0ABS5I3C7_9GAMM|nr:MULTISPECIES: RNA pseudouridine synthase [Shewanella]MBR9728532.1 RNA pseudouridine synthase [Shewanella intestini]MRG36351.1 RNA pseudouridine synthase [Shewanella sp. XMDDZSB0408]
MSFEKIQCHIKVTSIDVDAVTLLAQETGLSKQKIKIAMQKGAVWLTQGKQTLRLRRAKKALKIGNELDLYYNQQVLDEAVTPAEMLFDEGEYSLWYKPYGMRSQGSKWSDHTTIDRYVALNCQPQRSAYLIHRLDRAATGLMLIGHTKNATRAIANMFETRNLTKYYQVIVHGKFPTGTVSINTDVDNKPALSHATLIEYQAQLNQSLVSVKIESGRKHQIRIHMASLGYSVVGDRLHGKADEQSPNLKLTSCYFEFTCPLTHSVKVFELPQHLQPSFE